MNTIQNQGFSVGANIPVLAEATVINAPAMSGTFAAFKEEERLSFIRPYSPNVQAIAGYRHAVIRWRNTDKGTASKPAQMVTVPSLMLPEDNYLLPESAAKVLLGVLEDEQDAMIRAEIENKASYIGWDNVTLEKVLDSLTAIRVSQRLTKEQIEHWANVALVEFCNTRAAQICESKGITDATEIAKHQAGTLNAYKKRVMLLAAPVPNIGQGEATAVLNALTVAKLDDDMAKVLIKKLNAILNPKIIEDDYL